MHDDGKQGTSAAAAHGNKEGADGAQESHAQPGEGSDKGLPLGSKPEDYGGKGLEEGGEGHEEGQDGGDNGDEFEDGQEDGEHMSDDKDKVAPVEEKKENEEEDLRECAWEVLDTARVILHRSVSCIIHACGCQQAAAHLIVPCASPRSGPHRARRAAA
jgi:hypothetical protein